MKTKLTLLATGVGIALIGFTASAYDYDDYRENFPAEHLGARHIPFTGTHTILGYTDEGTPTPDGHGFRDLHGTSELTISVPSLGITDLILPFSIVSSADRDAEGNGTMWGTLESDYRNIVSGALHFAGRDTKVSNTLLRHTRQYGGGMWKYSPLDGANLLATEQIEVTLDGDGAVISRTSVVEGILIVPFYVNFAPFEGVDPLPPFKPATELPDGTGWRTYALNSEESAEFIPPSSIYIRQYISCAELDIRDLALSIDQSVIYYDLPIGRRYGGFEFQPIGQNEPFGHTTFQGMLGYVEGTEKSVRHDYMDHAGVFQTGPYAGCLYLRSHGGSFSLEPPFFLSTVLLVPDDVDLPKKPQKMLNISERGRVGTGDDVLIAGFVVSGKVPRTVLVRAVGPSLAPYGVTDFLADPVLNVYRTTPTGSVLIGTNSIWHENQDHPYIEELAEKAGAFALESGSNDSALVFTWLEPGSYTMKVSGVGGATGVALAEVYEIGN